MDNSNEWFPIDTMPTGVLVIVYLPDDSVCKYHTSIKRQCANGIVQIIGHYFASDLTSRPTHWTRLPSAPEGL